MSALREERGIPRGLGADARAEVGAEPDLGAQTGIAGLASCDIHTHTPAQKSYTNFILYPFVISICSTNWPRHGHGYEGHSSVGAEAGVSAVRARYMGSIRSTRCVACAT